MLNTPYNCDFEILNLNPDGTLINDLWTEVDYAKALLEEEIKAEASFFEEENSKKKIKLEEIAKTAFLKNTKSNKIASLEGVIPYIQSYLEFSEEILEIEPTHRQARGSGAGIFVEDNYQILGKDFEGDGFRYDNSKQYFDEIEEDIESRLDYYLKPFAYENTGLVTKVSLKNQ